MIYEIRQKNLFLIPLDTEGCWFRYQHLFAEVLYTLLRRDHPESINTLHLKAAAWFDREGYPDEAVEHALQSGNMLRARELVLRHWLAVLHRGEVATLLRWLDALPENKDGADPFVPLARCWALFLSWQNTAIEPHLEQAATAYQRLVDDASLNRAQSDEIAAQLAMMRSVLARERGDHDRSVAFAEAAARFIPQEMMEGIGTAWNMLAAARAGAGDFDGAIQAYQRGISLVYQEGNLVAAYGCVYGQCMYMLIQGRLTEAEALCRSAIDRAEREGHAEFPAAGSLYITMARIELERNQLEDAEANLNNGLRIARPGGFIEAERTGRYIRAQLAALRGDLEAAVNILEDLERIVTAMDEPYVLGELSWQWAAYYIKTGDLEAAREKLQILDEKIALTKHANLLLWRGWLFPRLLVAEGRYQEAGAVLDESIRRARVANSNGELVHLLALQAVVLDALGERFHAHASLLEGMVLGAPENYIWRWLDAGPGLTPLLRDMRVDGETPQALRTYLDSLLNACRTTYSEPIQPQTGMLTDLLTPREVEILRLICQGYSNPKIANQLVVTVNTIKKHTSNIYGKLGVRSRTQAMARAHELDLI
jgi:LuxR family maltose regulon positive regulatory protein